MTLTNPALRHSCAALAAAGALAGALAAPAGSAAAQEAYRGMPGYQPQAVYQGPPAYQPQAVYQAPPAWQAPPAYPPQAAYQPSPAYPPETTYRTVEQMTVIAPGVHRRTVGRSDTGIPVEELSLSRVVDVSDLDLSRWEDVQAMDYRVRMAALSACNALDRAYPQSMYPTYPSEDDHCVARAINEGVDQEHEAVAAAEANAYAVAAYRR